MFSYQCSACGELHEGVPSYAAMAPLSYEHVPESERAARCQLGSDDCVIDGSSFFVRGCIEIAVEGEEEPFVWGVWVSLSAASYQAWLDAYDLDKRAHIGPFFGWLNTSLAPYPDLGNFKTHVHLRDNGLRPIIELDHTERALSIEQRKGISRARLAEILTLMRHGR
ncbi:DUF2199 domain-containing protein [Massilia violaceinigra]|uniref:DUF2199 domain-containing protein n=1 Tax=Massilia violaceinigra TaxID=2045208 RepID=A0ABY4ABR6_9BURK|nr:DUF2199 domain-containing protein [Massilia violaceinigra]UOD32143.1 DUF2199 domain-containing protein [Massilia violaceinigra]